MGFYCGREDCNCLNLDGSFPVLVADICPACNSSTDNNSDRGQIYVCQCGHALCSRCISQQCQKEHEKEADVTTAFDVFNRYRNAMEKRIVMDFMRGHAYESWQPGVSTTIDTGNRLPVIALDGIICWVSSKLNYASQSYIKQCAITGAAKGRCVRSFEKKMMLANFASMIKCSGKIEQIILEMNGEEEDYKLATGDLASSVLIKVGRKRNHEEWNAIKTMVLQEFERLTGGKWRR